MWKGRYQWRLGEQCFSAITLMLCECCRKIHMWSSSASGMCRLKPWKNQNLSLMLYSWLAPTKPLGSFNSLFLQDLPLLCLTNQYICVDSKASTSCSCVHYLLTGVLYWRTAETFRHHNSQQHQIVELASVARVFSSRQFWFGALSLKKSHSFMIVEIAGNRPRSWWW